MDQYDTLVERALEGGTLERKELGYYCLKNKQNYLTAFDNFLKASEKGDSEASYVIGFMYLNGIGKMKNIEKATHYFKCAQENGCTKIPKKLQLIIFSHKDTQYSYVDIIDDEMCFYHVESHENSIRKKTFHEILQLGNDNPKLTIHSYDVDGNKVSPESQTSDYPNNKINPAHDASAELNRLEYLYDNMDLLIHEPNVNIDPLKDLSAMVGLSSIKTKIKKINNRISFDAKRARYNLSVTSSSNHFVFAGNPGTGKTEVARKLGHILLNEGILYSGHVVEISSSHLKAGWEGHSALKTRSAVEKAIGGILFIDEAYSIISENYWGTGDEVLSTLLKMMEDHRDELIVIFAGYPEEIKLLLDSNPGLRSRFRHNLTFEDYTAEELTGIYSCFCNENQYLLSEDAKTVVNSLMRDAIKYENKKTFGNARFARNAFEITIEKMAQRIIDSKKKSKKDLQTILFCDIPTLKEINGFIQTK